MKTPQLRHIPFDSLYHAQHGWLNTRFHFSFAQYSNPDNIQFGVLRVLNDDHIAAESGFDLHAHRNMEILTYIIEGELTHADSLGNEATLGRGEMQYMSAGRGIHHSEHNRSNEDLHLFQIWILPAVKGSEPGYRDYRPAFSERENRLLHLATGDGSAANPAALDGSLPCRIGQDLNFYASAITRPLDFELSPGRQLYLAVVEGGGILRVSGGDFGDGESLTLGSGDAVELIARTAGRNGGEPLTLQFSPLGPAGSAAQAGEPFHFVLLEMAVSG